MQKINIKNYLKKKKIKKSEYGTNRCHTISEEK